MKIDFMTAMTLLGALNMEFQKIWKDETLTVGELYEALGIIIDKLGLKDKVIFHKEKKENK